MKYIGNKLISVTEPYMPNIDKYKKYIDIIYKNKWLTNNGELVQELTTRLEEHLGVKHLLLVANGTLALQLASSLLNIKNKVLTTPFSFVATTNSQLWENINVKFSDINKDTFNMSTSEIIKNIDDQIEAIVPVHVFGNPCELEAITKIATEKNLKIIYDAAHAFGVRYKGKSILTYGDISILSFHATKLFHSVEGGALIFNDKELYTKAKSLINFGYNDGEIHYAGINAKMSEFHAAMGLCVLDDIAKITSKRKYQYLYYLEKLTGAEDIRFQKLDVNTDYNYSYFPVLFNNKDTTLNVINKLMAIDIFPRRYFYPSLNKLKYINEKQAMPNSEEISECILCLPLFDDLTESIQNKIISVILENK